jgi:D-alanyl-lipoteichoic acid acyltransferase DltB (MBOAT superfamily)
MLFNSANFLVFFVITYGLYVLIRDFRKQNFILLIASYVFYSAWDVRFLPLLLFCTVVTYWAALRIETASAPRERKLYLGIGVATSMAVLGFFKYYNFGIESTQAMLQALGLKAHLPTLRIILPVGISFYTFQKVSYCVDVYRREIKATFNFIEFALYGALFPQLVAGPIEQSTHLLPQLQRPRVITNEDFRIGFLWCLLGYAKKVVFADTLAPMVDRVFSQPTAYSGATCAMAIVAFAVQIYGDFSGYTLIARGVARFFGIHLMENFRMPYLAVSPRDFWRRWHISLSMWLRKYLYFGLGGNRISPGRTYVNLMLTMLLGGLWHGASWTFVLWGGYHGLLLCICHYLDISDEREEMDRLQLVARIVGTFVLTLFGWLLFRVQSMEQLGTFLRKMATDFRWDDETSFYAVPTLSMLAVLMTYHLWQLRRDDMLVLLAANRWLRRGVYAGCLLLIIAVGFRPVPFVYFQF